MWLHEVHLLRVLRVQYTVKVLTDRVESECNVPIQIFQEIVQEVRYNGWFTEQFVQLWFDNDVRDAVPQLICTTVKLLARSLLV